MTKIDVTDLSEMTEQNLTVDDILNENLIIRKKKIDYVIDEAKNENKKIDKTVNMNLKRKAKFDLNEDFSIEKLAHPNINISIDTETNKTIRLELRHPDNQCVITDYKITDADDVRLALETEELNGYSLKDNLRMEDKNEDLNVRNGGEFTNGNDDEDKYFNRDVNVCCCPLSVWKVELQEN
ncbi:unnamed protein product [Euphydryas editha]|uniref:Uncharacterized protein n=1 Tax=Euphydryas editha TaxID=104508 RepID=A0AAU9ULN8_EUPED|nr:unnamed protein product [Euphydryas editha]